MLISVTKEGVRFSVTGDSGMNGNIQCRSSTDVDTKPEDTVHVELQEPVKLSFALRYLNFFTKATSLSQQVTISLAPEIPLVVEYPIEELGYVRYFLAPKIDDE